MTTCGAGEILEAEQGNRFLPRGQYSNATLEIDEPSTWKFCATSSEALIQWR